MTILGKGISLSLIVSFFIAPATSQAWFFPVAQAQSDATAAPTYNVQTLNLLSPRVAMASDRKAVDEDAVITIVDDEALSADMGASGSLADVVDDGGDISVYVVKSGDTVASVAKLFNVTENTVRWTNGMSKTDVLHVGDTLLILPFNGAKITVAKGDTLAGIEKKFGLSSDEIDDLLSYNDLAAGSKLTVGQTLYIPGAELGTTAGTVAKTNASKSKSTSSASTSNVTRGYFIRPLSSSCRMSQGKHDKYAVDLACPIGTPIKAAASGVVQFAKYGWNGAFGNLIIIKHPNGMITYYAHIKDGGIAVEQGESVSQGEIIGYVGSTGRSTGPHLHFEVRNGVNPGFDKTGSAWK